MLLDENLENPDNSNKEYSDRETTTYLNELEAELYKSVQTRSRIDYGLLFVSCQLSSVSISWLLYSLQVSLLPICLVSALVAATPGLISVTDTFGNFSINSERWELELKEKPLAGFVKLGVGLLTAYAGNSKIIKLETDSKIAIAQAYTQIKSHQPQHYTFTLPTDSGIILVCLMGVGALVLKVRSLFNRNQEDTKHETDS